MYSLIGIGGNAFAVMGYVIKCMKKEKFSKEDIDMYLTKAKTSNYDNLLRVSIDYVELCNEKASASGETVDEADHYDYVNAKVFSVDD